MFLIQLMRRMAIGMAVVGAVLIASHRCDADAEVPAFPGAEGFGAVSVGGRGGQIVHVTNLDDSGPGSLRQAVSEPHRIVVFDVGGYINLKSTLQIASQITIAGQTAPGDGVAALGCEVSLSNSHDIVIRYMRIRQGITPGQDKKSAINVTSGQNIILDHDSIQWGRWDTIDMNMCTNVTVQDCIIGPGVAPQRFGCLCQSDGVTFVRNLWASNHSRNPKAKGKIEAVNNVVYNWGVCGFVGGHSAADHGVDIVGNYFIAGPDSSEHALGEFTKTDHVYESGNMVATGRTGKLDGRPVAHGDFGSGSDAPVFVLASTIGTGSKVRITSAADAYAEILSGAGDSLHRDAVDLRILDDVKSLGKSGKNIEDPAEMGGAGSLADSKLTGPIPADGIPDAWKREHSLSTTDPAVAQQRAPDGYPWIEEYLNSLVK